MMGLDGKIAMVTGAATGIGAALAQALSSSGARVIGVDLKWDGAEKTPGVEQAKCDVADPMSVKTCVADIQARHGSVDILINNAALASQLTPTPFEHIVNLRSATIFIGMPPMLHYVAGKGAIAIMTPGLARELGRDGITVNAIAPGLTMTKGIKGNQAYSEKLIAQALAAQSIPNREQPEDLVAACLYLVSDGAKMMTGQILAVDGGTAFH